MKNKIYLFGIFSVILISFGAYFKVQHWPGGNILLMGSYLILSFIFVPFALYSSFKAEENRHFKILYIVTGFVTAFIFIGSLFKIMHWPGSGILMFIAIPLPFVVLLPMFLYFNRKDKEVNYRNFMPVMFFFAYFAAISSLLSVGVTRDLVNSYIQSANNFDSRTLSMENQNKAMMSLMQKDTILSNSERQRMTEILNQAEMVENRIEELKKYLVLEKTGNPPDVYQNGILKTDRLLYKDNKIYVTDNEVDNLYSELVKFKGLLLSEPDLPLETRSYIETSIIGGQKEAWVQELFNDRLLVSAVDGLNMLKYKIQTIQFAVLVL